MGEHKKEVHRVPPPAADKAAATMPDAYLTQPKGPGTAFQFRMRTPAALLNTVDPLSGRPFGSTIRRGFGPPAFPASTRDLREARTRAAILRGRYLALAANPLGMSDERALVWAELVAKQRASGSGPDDPEPDLASLAEDEAAHDEAAAIAARLPAPARAARAAQRSRFLAIASDARGLPLDRLLSDYLTARSPGNLAGLAPLALTTTNDLRSAFKHVATFLERELGSCFIGDMTADEVHRFRIGYLRARVSPKTAAKYETLLAGAWRWAREVRLPGAPDADSAVRDVWSELKLIRRARKAPDATSREAFTAAETAALLAGLNEPLAPLFRLLLVTGCRVDEVAQLALGDVVAGAGVPVGFTIRTGKIANAVRYVPVPGIARGLFTALVSRALASLGAAEGVGICGRLFPTIPVRPASGKAAAASQSFTRERRRILGAASDGRLALHSTRHTWRTLARRARVPDDVANDLGGWAGPRRSSSVYDHGLLRGQLEEAEARRRVGDGHDDAVSPGR